MRPLTDARRGRCIKQERTDILVRHRVTMGNTGVTKICVVRRGALQRDEAREDQTASVRKLFKVKSVA